MLCLKPAKNVRKCQGIILPSTGTRYFDFSGFYPLKLGLMAAPPDGYDGYKEFEALFGSCDSWDGPDGGCAGDVDESGKVDLIDFEILRRELSGQWTTRMADIDADGDVDLLDFEQWRHGNGALNEPLPPAAPCEGPCLQALAPDYVMKASNEAGGPAINYVSIAGQPGASLGPRADDATTSPLALGFNFPYYGSLNPTVVAATNGFLEFGSQNAAFTNQILPDLTLPNAVIAPLWDNAMVAESPVKLTAAATDACGGIDQTAFEVFFDSAWHAAGTDVTGSDGWEVLSDNAGVADQIIAVRAFAGDKAGNGALSPANSAVVLDRTPPELTAINFSPA